MKNIKIRYYLYYKFLNSLFLGLSVGSVFVLYTPLEPSIYSIGGIVLALGMLALAKIYYKIMNIRAFFYITFLVESIVLAFVAAFLILKYSYHSALLVYIGYQLTFVFGSYLVRMETIALHKTRVLSWADAMKQKGYLSGLVLSYGFYKTLDFMEIIDKQTQVYDLYILLLLLEIGIIFIVYKAFVFTKEKKEQR
ncbi:hypothetical protein [Sulfurospirillum sp. 1612]|uniref:hypothetical protein n=1 Tax=Sulfurospirillum sp. 1612 TaxID=3094835 RepID=UPI002F938FE7